MDESGRRRLQGEEKTRQVLFVDLPSTWIHLLSNYGDSHFPCNDRVISNALTDREEPKTSILIGKS
jgi:hypothetical protein